MFYPEGGTSFIETLFLPKWQNVLKLSCRDFPGGPVVKNLPSSAGNTGSSPGRGTKIPHAAGQVSPRARTTELARLNERARVQQLRSPRALEPARHN